MSHFFPQKDSAPTREPLSNDKTLWQGKPSSKTVLSSIIICIVFGGLIFPLWIAYRIWSKHNNTHYLVTQRYIQIRNDHFEKENRILEIYRVQSIEAEPYGTNGLQTVSIIPADDYTPPVRYIGVEMGPDDLQRIREAIEATREKKRVAAISLPVLG